MPESEPLTADHGTEVDVTAGEIAAGEPGDCWGCPVALALARATGDQGACVYGRDFEIWLDVWGRHLPAPGAVREFVNNFDGQPRGEDGRIDRGHEDYDPIAPFRFALPPLSDPGWREKCYGCEELVGPADLDDEGFCPCCRCLEGQD